MSYPPASFVADLDLCGLSRGRGIPDSLNPYSSKVVQCNSLCAIKILGSHRAPRAAWTYLCGTARGLMHPAEIRYLC